MSRYSDHPGEIRLVQMTITVFRALFTGCSSAYFTKNPGHIARLTYRGSTLCYIVSDKLMESTDWDLYEAGYEDHWLKGAVSVITRVGCVRQGASIQLIRSAVCSGPTAGEDLIEGFIRIDPARGFGGVYLVPPCVATMLLVPAMWRSGYHQAETVIKLTPRQSERRPNQTDELILALGELTLGLSDDEQKTDLVAIQSACVELARARGIVVAAERGVNLAIDQYNEHRRSADVRGVDISTTPKVFGIQIGGYYDGKHYKIGPSSDD